MSKQYFSRGNELPVAFAFLNYNHGKATVTFYELDNSVSVEVPKYGISFTTRPKKKVYASTNSALTWINRVIEIHEQIKAEAQQRSSGDDNHWSQLYSFDPEATA